MSIDRIAFPLPAVVNGYACLNEAEIELAKDDIDPARPSATPQPAGSAARDTPAAVKNAAIGATTMAERKNNVAPADQAERILSYAPGAVRTTPPPKATSYSITA